MDRGAWQTAVYGVAKRWTQLKQLSMHAHTHSPFGTETAVCWVYAQIINTTVFLEGHSM